MPGLVFRFFGQASLSPQTVPLSSPAVLGLFLSDLAREGARRAEASTRIRKQSWVLFIVALIVRILVKRAGLHCQVRPVVKRPVTVTSEGQGQHQKGIYF